MAEIVQPSSSYCRIMSTWGTGRDCLASAHLPVGSFCKVRTAPPTQASQELAAH